MANSNLGDNNRERSGISRRGFASMDRERQREIASRGGKASAEGDTSNRGFASMDAEKQRRIASVGGKASGEARRNNSLRNNQMGENRDNSGWSRSNENRRGSEWQ